ncbi:uncharacterized protein LOC129764433 [Toxorhynchites rutilus septentrionalis]|uniref:uncharacterized protein LOC129764433 n=1 Tax=Toxorhynchites rutilus septentrionalis TaxID=329112 RepID=UPI002479C386|nr:uncharacterized protein LOC129764433 [Toxorhynchites rutilus septentrionalis]
MVSNNAFHIMGYIYVGLCLISSLLLIINSSHTLKATGYEWVIDDSGRYKVISTNMSVTSVTTLIVAINSMIFDLCLLLGLKMRNITLVKCHMFYITIAFVLMVLGLFIGCIMAGLSVGDRASYNRVEENSAIVIAVTLLFIFFTTVITLFFTHAIWILNGVVEYIRSEQNDQSYYMSFKKKYLPHALKIIMACITGKNAVGKHNFSMAMDNNLLQFNYD